MASPFTEQERSIIKKSLHEAARKYAAGIGMRNTTVDQLAKEAGISKGAFYKFYASKEHLFFEILESWHTELYEAAFIKWQSAAGLAAPQRAAETLLEVCRLLEYNSMLNFIEEDISHVLRKIPAEVLEKHYHSDDIHIRELMERMDIKLKQPPEVASAAIRALLLTLSNRNNIGTAFPQVLKLMVFGVCEQLIVQEH